MSGTSASNFLCVCRQVAFRQQPRVHKLLSMNPSLQGGTGWFSSYECQRVGIPRPLPDIQSLSPDCCVASQMPRTRLQSHTPVSPQWWKPSGLGSGNKPRLIFSRAQSHSRQARFTSASMPGGQNAHFHLTQRPG